MICNFATWNVTKKVRWYTKVFPHLTDVMLLNVYNLYLFRSQKKLKFHEFAYTVVFQMLEKYGTMTTVEKWWRFAALTDRLTGKEFLQHHYLAPTTATGEGKRKQILCHVCRNTTGHEQVHKVTTWCPECQVDLCLGVLLWLPHISQLLDKV